VNEGHIVKEGLEIQLPYNLTLLQLKFVKWVIFVQLVLNQLKELENAHLDFIVIIN
jgi:hypothetical protein